MILVDIRKGATEVVEGEDLIVFSMGNQHVITTPYPADKDEFIKWASVGAKEALGKGKDSIYYLAMALHILIYKERPKMVREIMKENRMILPWWKRAYINRVYATIPVVARALI